MDLEIRKYFPLDSTESVIKLFKSQLDVAEQHVDLTLISICLGFFENILCNREMIENKFPTLDYETFMQLYKKFKTIVSAAETQLTQSKGKLKTTENQDEIKYPTREKIKKISDVIWNSLLRSSYKDRVHLQSVYSYLTGNKLDSFGFALVTVVACQLLNYDIHLALTEDHVWIVLQGKTGEETMEITWHGKIAEDKRGQSVIPGIEAHTWLYLAGNPVICTRYTELAVIVLSINPHLNSTSVCAELADLQQQLLWILYDKGHLKNYPMSLMYLGEMEENHPTANRIKCEALYEQAIQSSIKYYKNHHVYPYSCKGNYYYRNENFREAFACWADAGDVIRMYNYSRDDEEIYKEFLDIANEQIPHIMKTESSGHSAKSILRDPQCFGNLLRFYDGICLWEEGSHTPILHIGWAKQLCFSISKFDYDIRSQIKIIIKSDYDDDNNNKKSNEPLIFNEQKTTETLKQPIAQEPAKVSSSSSNGEIKNEFPMLPSVDELTAACGEKLLNPDFLLHGGGVPFSEPTADDEHLIKLGGDKKDHVKESIMIDTSGHLKVSCNEQGKLQSPAQKDVSSPKLSSPRIVDDNKSEISKQEEDHQSNDTNNNDGRVENFDDGDENSPKRPIIVLKSRKMKGLKDLLLAEKLNTNAISLQITAQSHIGNKKSRSTISEESTGDGSRPKRTRRE